MTAPNTVTAITTADECVVAIAKIGKIDAQISAINTALRDKTAEAAKEAEDAATPLQVQREQIMAQVQKYCDKRRADLTNGLKKKFADFSTGRIGWKKGKDSVEVDPTKTTALIKKFTTGKLKRFLRYTDPTIDKQALLKEPKAAARYDGITITTGTDKFYVEPKQLELAKDKAA